MLLARGLASVLREDPIVAAQIKEYVPASELLELLGITDAELNAEVARRYPAVPAEVE